MATIKNIFSLFFFSMCVVFNINAQEEITFRNPSFEDPPMETFSRPFCCLGPRGWFSCGHGEDLNTPDAQPGNHGVTVPAADGGFYIGMVTRDNDTWEGISQRLKTPLFGGSCYTFSLKLCHSDLLKSQSRRTLQEVKYDKPVKVRIWGGNGYCDDKELLDESPLIDHTYWKQYNFRFEPKRDYFYVTIEVFYKTPTPIPYNGNILLDDASGIKVVPCSDEEEPPIVDIGGKPDTPVNVSPRPKTDPKPDPKPSDPIVSTPPRKDPPVDTKPKTNILKLDRKKLVEGEVIRIENLYFKADSANVSVDAYPVLDEIYYFLRTNPKISIEVGGHTNNRCATNFCNDLSEKRAQAVADYLKAKGIRRNRLLFKGYGKTNPVASNSTPAGRLRNQRVEIKILSLDG